MNVGFTPTGWRDFTSWIGDDLQVLNKLIVLLDDVRRSPFRGLGKPEPLKGDRAGWWSRRITDEHRLIYRVFGKGANQRIEVAQCRNHY